MAKINFYIKNESGFKSLIVKGNQVIITGDWFTYGSFCCIHSLSEVAARLVKKLGIALIYDKRRCMDIDVVNTFNSKMVNIENVTNRIHKHEFKYPIDAPELTFEIEEFLSLAIIHSWYDTGILNDLKFNAKYSKTYPEFLLLKESQNAITKVTEELHETSVKTKKELSYTDEPF